MTLTVDIKRDPVVSLKARRTLDGNIMIFDHEDIDIYLSVEGKKFLTFPKGQMNDKAYQAQDRVFEYLAKRGIVDKSSVRGGNIHGSLEARVLESKVPGVDPLQACLYAINEYLNQEKPCLSHYMATAVFGRYINKRYPHPSSTHCHQQLWQMQDSLL